MKTTNGGVISGILTNNCAGALTTNDCDDLVISNVNAIRDVNSGLGTIYMQGNDRRVQIRNILIDQANKQRCIRVDGDDCVVSDVTLINGRTAVASSGDIVVQGNRNLVRGVNHRNTDSNGGNIVVFVTSASASAHIADIKGDYALELVRVEGGATDTVVRVEPEDVLNFATGGSIAVNNSGTRTSVSFPVLTGSGTPEGSVTARVGRLYARTDGGSGTTLYVKESGTGNTGWSAV